MTVDLLQEFGLSDRGPIDLARDRDGQPRSFMPQDGYDNRRGLALNRHGAGPFGQLIPPRLSASAGVYAVVVHDEVVYVGEAQDLTQRWGPQGYGVIHPRNCFTGGQPTNCKVNARIYALHLGGVAPRLYARLASDDRKLVERALIDRIRPSWNG